MYGEKLAMFRQAGSADFGEVVGREFFDKFLLSIIDAYPRPSSSALAAARLRAKRLREARRALLGEPNPEGRPSETDTTVLRWIGLQHHRDLSKRGLAALQGEAEPKSRSVHKLVAEAVRHFGLTSSAEERLRKKLNADGLEKWFNVADLHDDVPEQLDMNLLQELRQVLTQRGISMNLAAVEK
jgi:hypothetical protein